MYDKKVFAGIVCVDTNEIWLCIDCRIKQIESIFIIINIIINILVAISQLIN